MKRRDVLAASGPLLTTGLAGCSAPAGDAGDVDDGDGGDDGVGRQALEAWPMFLHGRTHRRCFGADEPTVRDPQQRWTYSTDDAVWSSPVVADGTLYVGSYDGHLYAISTESGELQWRYRTGDRIDGSPAVVDGTVFVGSFDRNIYALDAETGEERWMYGTKGIVRSSPTVRDGVVYVGAFCRSEECNAYYDVRWPEQGYLYALGAETGDLHWRYETGDGVISTTAVADGTAYVGSSDGNIYAFDAATGETRWRYGTNGPIMSSPVVADGRVFVGNVAGRLYSVDAAGGDLDWSYEASRGASQGVDLPVAITGSPLICGDTLYVGSMYPGDELIGRLLAVSTDGGNGEFTAGPFGQAVGSSPLAVNGRLYFGAHTFGPTPGIASGIFALDTEGEEHWRFTVGDRHEGFGSSPAVVDSTLYIGGTGGTVYAFDL